MWLHPQGFFSEYCNPMEKGPEQGQDCAAFFIIRVFLSWPNRRYAKAFSSEHATLQPDQGCCTNEQIILLDPSLPVLLHLSLASVPKLGLSAKTCIRCEIISLCNYYCMCHSKQALSPEYYQSQNMKAKRARIYNFSAHKQCFTEYYKNSKRATRSEPKSRRHCSRLYLLPRLLPCKGQHTEMFTPWGSNIHSLSTPSHSHSCRELYPSTKAELSYL